MGLDASHLDAKISRASKTTFSNGAMLSQPPSPTPGSNDSTPGAIASNMIGMR